MVTRVVFVLAPGVHLLDVAGPAQALSMVADRGGPAYQPIYVADSPTVLSYQGLPLVTRTDWPELDPADLVVVPGWRVCSPGPRLPIGDPLLERVAAHHRQGGEVMSVCSGAFALGRAGLLDGRRCTTHHDLQDELARRYPRAHVRRDLLFTSDSGLHTSAGIASGIDLALHLIVERHGAATAAQVARGMVVYTRRNGDQPQASVMLRHRDHLDDVVHRAQDLIDEKYAEPLPLPELAGTVGVSERTLTRAFTRTLGITPLRYQQQLRVERAELLIGSGSAVESAARSVGFEDARMLRRLRSR
jgi:transcriptional regulator GlxA family with amidase domain